MDYKQFEQEVRRMRMRANDAIDKSDDSSVQQLMSSLQRLEDDAQSEKSPDTLKSRLKDLRSQLERVENAEAMSPGDVDNLKDWVEDVIRSIS